MPSSVPELKPRERDILAQLAEGLSGPQIAARLGLAPETVRWYVKGIYAKLAVSSRDAAVARATTLGLLTRPSAAAQKVERSPIKYLVNEGVSIAYQVIGSGPVDLLFLSGFVSHLEISWQEPAYAAFMEELGRHARVIVFDRRGVGLSDRAQGAAALEDTISDAHALLGAVGSKRAYVCGTSEGGAAAVVFASLRPDLVQGLVLIAATAMPVRRDAEPEWSQPVDAFEQMIVAMKSTWGEPWSIERMAPSLRGNPAFELWWARALRAASSPSSVELILRQTMKVDIRALLPLVQTRTLVIHRRGDRVVPIAAGRYLAAHLPRARLVELSGDDHLFFADGLPIAREVARFLAAPDVEPDADTWVAILLHMSGNGSTLNAEKQRILAAQHPRAVHANPTGWVAVFDSPARALRCAEQMRALGRGRVGGIALHIGPCRNSDHVPVGRTHSVATRLLTRAKPGEILMSETLQDILAR